MHGQMRKPNKSRIRLLRLKPYPRNFREEFCAAEGLGGLSATRARRKADCQKPAKTAESGIGISFNLLSCDELCNVHMGCIWA